MQLCDILATLIFGRTYLHISESKEDKLQLKFSKLVSGTVTLFTSSMKQMDDGLSGGLCSFHTCQIHIVYSNLHFIVIQNSLKL